MPDVRVARDATVGARALARLDARACPRGARASSGAEAAAPPRATAVRLELGFAGPRVPMPPPRRSRWCHMPRIRGGCTRAGPARPGASPRRSTVLGEDVEDQLRPVDDPRTSARPESFAAAVGRARRRRRGTSPAALREASRARRAFPSRRRFGDPARARLARAPRGLDYRRYAEPPQLPELVLVRRTPWERRRREIRAPAPPRRGSGWCWVTADYAPVSTRSEVAIREAASSSRSSATVSEMRT